MFQSITKQPYLRLLFKLGDESNMATSSESIALELIETLVDSLVLDLLKVEL